MGRRRNGKRAPSDAQRADGTLKRRNCNHGLEEEEDEEEQIYSDEKNESNTKTLGEHLMEGGGDDDDDDVGEDCGGAPVDTVDFSGSTTVQSSTLSSITYVASEKHKMSVIQKSNLLNWVDEVFSRHNKVLMLADLEDNIQLHNKICQEIKISVDEWAKYRKEALLTIKTQITEKMSSHRKSVRSLYRGKIILIIDDSFHLANFCYVFQHTCQNTGRMWRII